ncbi:hypothetical protein [Pseudorhizobium marinum]|uniref:hypothetical protein n=1 Tax=Pseudorhizobium marinum TaxID=1496690 RepID=UPI0012DF6E72|nr:hypothetical protein [Pseudorhizobium marinum]
MSRLHSRMITAIRSGNCRSQWPCRFVAALVLLAAVASSPTAGQAGDGQAPPRREAAQVFFSGHSLIDNPLPDWVELIATSLGKRISWEQQMILGSPLRLRTRGEGPTGWKGYRYGKNRVGEGMDVIDELGQGRSAGTGRPYDTLVVAENHGLLGSIIWENGIGYLRHFHDRLTAVNPSGRTLYVHAWLGIDRQDPGRFVAREMEISRIWECAAEKANLSLEAENRPAGLSVIPAGSALATLVQRGLSGQVADLAGSPVQVVDAIFRDDVHLTDPGIYFLAAVHYAAIYGQSPQGAAAPGSVAPDLAAELQTLAWQVVQRFQESRRPQMAECRRILVDSVCESYWSYTQSYEEIGRCKGYFSRTDPEREGNPFVWPDSQWTALPFP